MNRIQFPFRNAILSGVRLVANQLLPLLAFPFTLHVVGSQGFGTIIFTQAIAWYFVVFVEYGFNLTAVREIALERQNPEGVRQILYDVLITKMTLFVTSLLAVGVISALFFGEAKTVSLMLAMVLALGSALQPIWLFQGLEEFGLISAVQVVSRALCFGAIFVFVRDPGDANVAQLLMALPYCLNAAVLLPIAFRRFGGLPLRRLREWRDRVRSTLRDGADVFVSQLSTTLFSSTTTVLAGSVLGATFAGYYGIAEKLMRGIAMLTSPVSEALYPRLSTAFGSGNIAERRRAFELVRRVLLAVGGLLCVAGVVVIVASGYLADLVSAGGVGAHEIRTTFCWLAFVPMMIFINNIFGVQVLLGSGFKRQYRNAVLVAGLLIPLLGLSLPHLIGFKGFPIALFSGELLLAALTYVFAKKHTEWGRLHGV